ncbi:hypothetical protein M3Y99_00643900 [Aphelenchoides fujianensis]|nr:hypothetical protein M3Y99_00643900 [Aphelenchoides fujianensis]
MLLPLLIALFVLLLVYNFHWKRRGLPPGPAPWPLVGNMPAFNRRPYGSFEEWQRRFGPVFTVWIAEQPAVVLADFATIRETLVERADAFAGRFGFGEQSRVMKGGRLGVVDVDGEFWREQRRFTLHTFRNFGMGRNLMEQKILAQTEEVLAEVRVEQERNGSVDLPELLQRCVGSVISRLLFGQGFEKDDFHTYKRLLTFLTDNAEEQLRALIVDLFSAGQETTATTLVFLVCYFLNHPQVGQRIERELAERVGSERLIQTDDRTALPYLNAVICETQRFLNLLPMNLFHATTKEVDVRGFRLPAGTCVIPQIACVLSNEKLFPNPHAFDPQRFLDESGRLKHLDEFIPFSAGKRSCLGESLARMELFLIAANLFNRFRIEPEDPQRPPSMHKIANFTARCPPFRVRVRSRY